MLRKREGFTLVELLVVIAIIIILAAILFPVFARAREKALQTKCINNLKQMGEAVAMYEDDYDNPMPFNVKDEPFTIATYHYTWKDLMEPYVKQLKGNHYAGELEEYEGELFKCPSAPIEEYEIAWQVMRTYGYNMYFSKYVSSSDVKYPSTTLRITETSTDDPDDPPAKLKGGSWACPKCGYSTIYAPGWHNGMADVLWADGHVSTMTRQRVMLDDGVVDTCVSGEDGKPIEHTGNVWCRLYPKPAYTPG
ncbi:MAG TPA: DUF1559 domain-containing protein [Armatimonadota bacterium]|nr:DUF1559 domain-containing protein [Armatimonadota bacterium]